MIGGIAMYATFNLKNKSLNMVASEYVSFENSKYLAFYEGVPNSHFQELMEKPTLNSCWMNAFKGPFQVIIFDKNSRELLITQHLFGNGRNIYFCKRDNTIYLSSTLRELKNILAIQFKLNISMLPHYFYNGFLAGTHTLVDGVQKLEAGMYYIIKNDCIHKYKLAPNLEQMQLKQQADYTQLENEYSKALSDSISELDISSEDKLAISLSGGFDSNCILHNFKKQYPQKRIEAFSIGGIKGVDETGIASKIAAFYDVNFTTSFVNTETLKHLDEIVAILEGSVYERGIFLQYELAKIIRKNNINTLICGECADQVFHQNTYKNIPDNTFLYGYNETPYQMAVYTVLRKNRMIMDAYNIQTIYPFLTPQMIGIGYKTKDLNCFTKEFHKAQCKKILPHYVLELIIKQGGTTDLQALFPDDFDCSKAITKCKYYSKDFILTQKYDREEAIRDYYLSLLFLESFEKQFCC